jgi:hypothetical protein
MIRMSADGLTTGELRALADKLGIAERSQLWSAAVFHRQACVRFIKRRVFEWLDDPAMTRGRLKRELAALVTQVEEKGC